MNDYYCVFFFFFFSSSEKDKTKPPTVPYSLLRYKCVTEITVYILGLLVLFWSSWCKLNAIDKQFFMVCSYVKVLNGNKKYFKHKISLFHVTLGLGMPFCNQM